MAIAETSASKLSTMSTRQFETRTVLFGELEDGAKFYEPDDTLYVKTSCDSARTTDGWECRFVAREPVEVRTNK